MAKSIEAIVKPELLVWARGSAGLRLEDAAKKIGIKVEKLELWEKGEVRPTISQLRKAAKAYKRPLAIFYLSTPPTTFDAMRDYRRIAENGQIEKSPALLLEIRKARYRREVALDLLQGLREEIPRFEEKASLNDDPDILSEHIRELLKVSMEEQYKWRDSRQAFNRWKDAIENFGVLVFQTIRTRYHRIDLEEMRGFSVSEDELPAIVINSKDSLNGKTFTLLHEFSHLLLHNGGICDLEQYEYSTTDIQRTEVFCNRVAGSTLVPGDRLLDEDIVTRKGKQKSWSEAELYELASRFSVSREVIIRRLLALDRTTAGFYQKKRDEYHDSYLKSELDAKQQSQGKKIVVPYHRLVVRNNGSPYIKIVLNAYYQEFITSSEVSDYLGTKLKHLDKIEQAVIGASS